MHISQSTYARIENAETNSWAIYIEPLGKLFEIQPEELLRQETIKVDKIKNNNGALYNVGNINQMSEKLITQYEENAKLKDSIIADLRARLAKYEG